MDSFLSKWSEAALTSLGFFWMAFWAFVLGYSISSAIQVFVTEERMKRSLGSSDTGTLALAGFFGFISSSCSFAALATTKALFAKGAGLAPALAFLLASTNLVIELGIVIAIFLSWHFVVAEYIGGMLLILFCALLIRLTKPKSLIESARQRVADSDSGPKEAANWRSLIKSREGWSRVARQYWMEWQMVWRDVVFGFTVAGAISAFVPRAFFEALFVGSGKGANPSFGELLLQTLVGPLAAFFTFIGSMGNVPLASLLYSNGVSFAGIMAFLFSDLVVFPVLRISSEYFGWRMALYILFLFFVSLILTALTLHLGFSTLGLLPEAGSGIQVDPRERFAIDHTFFLNLAFLTLSGVFLYLRHSSSETQHRKEDSKSVLDRVLEALAIISLLWLAVGLLLSAAY